MSLLYPVSVRGKPPKLICVLPTKKDRSNMHGAHKNVTPKKAEGSAAENAPPVQSGDIERELYPALTQTKMATAGLAPLLGYRPDV